MAGWFKRLQRPTVWASLVMVAIAALCAAAWRWTNVADEWMPNLATTAIGIAATITVVEWILRREARDRLRPRTERVLDWIGLDIRLFVVGALLSDYASTHFDSYRPPPGDVLKMVEHWQAGHTSEDAPREQLEDSSRRAPIIVLEAVDLGRRLDEVRIRDLDVLEPDLVREIDDFVWAAGQAAQLCAIGRGPEANTDAHHRTAARLIVDHFEGLVRAFFRHGSPGWRQIPDLSRRATDERHEYLVAAASSGRL